jgi:outer membrane protein assembly factor BamB
MKNLFKNSIALLVFTCCLLNLQAQQTNWTHFRGSGLNGISAEKVVPVIWNDSTNVVWKTKIEGKGWSSPVVYDNQVWLTTSTENGKQMYGLCIDFKTGKEILRTQIFEPSSVFSKHDFNSYATPTPCIEPGFVYLHFGTYGTACLRTGDGSIVWKRTDLNCNHVQGPGSSPIIYKDLLILHLEGTDIQYIVALNKITGETVWKTDRPAECYEKLANIGKKAYITPIIVNVKGKDLLISNGSAVCIAYDPESGKEVWRVVQGEDSTIAMPSEENGIVFFFTSFVTPKEGEQYCELLAVDPRGKGDVTNTHVLWRYQSPILQLLTPLVKNGLIYFVDTKNNLFCLEAATGKKVYTKRLTGKYNSSPVYAGGNIFFISNTGETLIIREGRKLEITGTNKLTGEVNATPAVLNNSIIIRTNNYLYKIGSNNMK